MADFDLLNEKFPRISNKLIGLWGTKECRAELIKLISDSRGGTRQGFPPDVAASIIRLLQEHDDYFPQWNDSFDTPIPFTGHMRPVRAKVTDSSGYSTIIRLAVIFAGLVLVMGIVKEAYKLGLFS